MSLFEKTKTSKHYKPISLFEKTKIIAFEWKAGMARVMTFCYF